MRAITPDLAAVQLVRSPRARVTATVERRGQSVVSPAVAWTELIGNVGQVTFKQTAAVGRADGFVLRFIRDTSSTVIQQAIQNPTLASHWTSPASTITVISGFGVNSIAALRVPNTSTIRLWYIRSNGNVYYIESTNNGASYGAAVTVYSGGDANADMVVGYIDNGTVANGPWFFGFSKFSAGVYTPAFGHYDGASWVTTVYGSSGWRAAGIVERVGNTARRSLMYRQQDMGVSRLRAVTTNAGGTYAAEVDMDMAQAGRFGLSLSFAKFCHLPQLGFVGWIAGEHAYGAGAFMGYGSYFSNSIASSLVDEPIMFPRIACANSSPPTYLCETPDGSIYLVGDTVVYRGVPQAATSSTLQAVEYTYDDGELEIEFEASALELYVGQILVLNRTLSFNTQSGSQVVRFYIVRVQKSPEWIRVLAVDAVGFLGMSRCRRPSIVNDGTAAGLATVMRKLAARCGLVLTADDSVQETAAVMPLTLQPAESLLGAAYRCISQSAAFIVVDNDGLFALTLITPPDSNSSGDYDDAVTYNQYGQAGNQQPITNVIAVSDYRRLAFAYILGTYSTDPEDGGALGMAQGPVIDNTRPLSYSLTNTRYNTTVRVENAAQAEADRQQKLPITAIVQAHANLALEVYDLIQVTDPRLGWVNRQFRVRRIKEVYDRGVMTQTLYCGETT